MFKAEGLAILGLFTAIENGTRKILVKCKPEIGCFDEMEIARTVQLEFTELDENDSITELFLEMYRQKKVF